MAGHPSLLGLPFGWANGAIEYASSAVSGVSSEVSVDVEGAEEELVEVSRDMAGVNGRVFDDDEEW
jgi:hypothetical protein